MDPRITRRSSCSCTSGSGAAEKQVHQGAERNWGVQGRGYFYGKYPLFLWKQSIISMENMGLFSYL